MSWIQGHWNSARSRLLQGVWRRLVRRAPHMVRSCKIWVQLLSSVAPLRFGIQLAGCRRCVFDGAAPLPGYKFQTHVQPRKIRIGGNVYYNGLFTGYCLPRILYTPIFWLVLGNICYFYIYWEPSSQLALTFFRGVGSTTNQIQYFLCIQFLLLETPFIGCWNSRLRCWKFDPVVKFYSPTL